MRFLVDECTGPAVAQWLREKGHDVFSVQAQAAGSSDSALITQAWIEKRLIITNDKDFGEKVYREGHPHHGVILMRLANERSAVKIETLRHLLNKYADQLPGQFVIVTETKVRFSRR